MKEICCLLVFSATIFGAAAQDAVPRLFRDAKTGCIVLDTYQDSTAEAHWSGACEKGKATGEGTLSWFREDTEISTYAGMMKDGRPEGWGNYRLGNGVRLTGNFHKGQLLDLNPNCLPLLQRQVLFKTDPDRNYVHDEEEQELFYYALIPPKINGVLVLINGTWETAEHNLSSNKELCGMAVQSGIAVLVPSLNQRLVLNKSVQQLLNDCFRDAISRYRLPKDRFVLGGWSMGGLFSLRYTALSFEDSTATVVRPKAVFSVDGPVDLASMHAKWTRDLQNTRNNNKYEPTYALRELEQNIGATPAEDPQRYIRYSVYSHDAPDGGTSKYLLQVPLRIYNDVDVDWWIRNRGTDLYGMNALDQSAMINHLMGAGNRRAEFINAFGKGYRLEGFRHPHSWSLVDPAECMRWMLEVLYN